MNINIVRNVANTDMNVIFNIFISIVSFISINNTIYIPVISP